MKKKFDKRKNKSLVFMSQKHEGISACEFWSGPMQKQNLLKNLQQTVLSSGKLHSQNKWHTTFQSLATPCPRA